MPAHAHVGASHSSAYGMRSARPLATTSSGCRRHTMTTGSQFARSQSRAKWAPTDLTTLVDRPAGACFGTANRAATRSCSVACGCSGWHGATRSSLPVRRKISIASPMLSADVLRCVTERGSPESPVRVRARIVARNHRMTTEAPERAPGVRAGLWMIGLSHVRRHRASIATLQKAMRCPTVRHRPPRRAAVPRHVSQCRTRCPRGRS